MHPRWLKGVIKSCWFRRSRKICWFLGDWSWWGQRRWRAHVLFGAQAWQVLCGPIQVARVAFCWWRLGWWLRQRQRGLKSRVCRVKWLPWWGADAWFRWALQGRQSRLRSLETDKNRGSRLIVARQSPKEKQKWCDYSCPTKTVASWQYDTTRQRWCRVWLWGLVLGRRPRILLIINR